jgi:hypothetical protein
MDPKDLNPGLTAGEEQQHFTQSASQEQDMDSEQRMTADC